MKDPNPSNKKRIRENVVGTDWSNKSVVIVTQPTCTHCKELMLVLDNIKIPYETLEITTEKGRQYAIESGSKTTPVVVLMTSDIVTKYLSLDTISMKCMVTEIQNHMK